jgi:hypothetical protein
MKPIRSLCCESPFGVASIAQGFFRARAALINFAGVVGHGALALRGAYEATKGSQTRPVFCFSYPLTARGELQWTTQGLEPAQLEVLLDDDGAGGFEKKMELGDETSPPRGRFRVEFYALRRVTHCGDFNAKSTHCGGFTAKSTHCRGFTAKSTHCGGFNVKSTHCGGFTAKSTHCGGFTAKSTHCGGFNAKSTR